MKPKAKGDIAAAQAIAYFINNGYEVCLPIGDKSDYDLVVEKENKLSRVQVKFAGQYVNTEKCIATLRVMGGNQSYHTAKKYSDLAFDYLFVYTAKATAYLIPWVDLEILSILSVEADKYSKYKLDLTPPTLARIS